MEIIRPIQFSNAMLASSTAVETVPLWSISQAYAIGNRARLDTTNKVYECLVANTGASPDTNVSGATPKWFEVGATNVFAMFDSKWGTCTTAASVLTVVLTPGVVIDSLALLNLTGYSVTVTCTVGGAVKYAKTVKLQSDVGVFDWKTYFMAPIVAKTDVVLTDLLPYAMQVITVTIVGAGTVSIGNVAMGSYTSLGFLEYSPTAGVIDYAQKVTDKYGATSVTPGAYSKRFGGKFTIDNESLDTVASILSSIRTTPVVWLGAGGLYSVLVVWGYCKDWEIDLSYPTISYCSINIEGLT